METLVFSILLVLLFLLLIFPIVLFFKLRQTKNHFWIYLVSGLIIALIIIAGFTWWADYSDKLLLLYYGYDFDAPNEAQRFARVDAAHLDTVKQIEHRYFGIGWPVKALLAYAYYSPYLIIAYLIGMLIKRIKQNRVKNHLY